MTQHQPTHLAVCGWSPEAHEAAMVLEGSGAFRVVAIADRSAANLIRARRGSDIPCYQHPTDMLRTADYDAVLIADPQGSVAGSDARTRSAAALAAARGKEILLLASECSGAALLDAVRATTAHGVRLQLLNPARHEAGLADLVQRIEDEPAWAPAYLDITVEAPTDAARLLAIATSHFAALTPHRQLDTDVRASTWDTPARVISATLEVGAAPASAALHATIRVRHAPESYVRIAGDSPAGAFELRIHEGEADLAFTSTTGIRYRPQPVASWKTEAGRVADRATDDTSAARALGMLLDTIDRAVHTGDVQTTSCCREPALRLVHGMRDEQAPAGPRPSTRLRLVHA